MPQLFPMNWILLTMFMFVMMITMIVNLYFLLILNLNLYKNIPKPNMHILSNKW
uniref:ATP synthase subunit 8 n=1 Tax=Amblyomma limbatum TaxID=591489 RepID=UPI0030FE31AF